MAKVSITFSPQDNRDYKASDFLTGAFSSEDLIPSSYQAPRTAVRCQWFSSQCVAYAVTQALSQIERQTFPYSYNVYSPGFLYANREDDDYQGDGWYIRRALKQLYHYGTVLESDFPFPESYAVERRKFLARRDELLPKAAPHKISAYFRCTTEQEIKRCILEQGACIISIPIYTRTFLLRRRLSLPPANKKALCYHALIIVGWDDSSNWIVQDSYSALRPCHGRILIPFDYPICEYWGLTTN